MSFSLSALWQSTGPFAKAIVIMMLMMSFLSVFVTCERIVVFLRAKRASRRYAAQVAKIFERGHLVRTQQRPADVGYLGRVIEAGIGVDARAVDIAASSNEFLDFIARLSLRGESRSRGPSELLSSGVR